jgi:hypothetical protein
LDRIFACRRACKPACEKSCCEKAPACGADPGCGAAGDKGGAGTQKGGAGTQKAGEAGKKTQVPPAPVVDPSAFLQSQRHVVQASTTLVR